MDIKSSAVVKELQKRVLGEWESIAVYARLADWCNLNAYEGAAKWFASYVVEETMHRAKVSDFLTAQGVMPVSASMGSLDVNVSSLEDCVDVWVEAMQKATAQILDVVRVAEEAEDYNVCNFMQFFVMDQREGEALAIQHKDWCTNIGLFSNAPDWAKGMMRAELDEKLGDLVDE